MTSSLSTPTSGLEAELFSAIRELGYTTSAQTHTVVDAVLAKLQYMMAEAPHVGEIVRSFSDPSGIDVKLTGSLTSDIPGIVGSKLYLKLDIRS